MGLEVKAIPAMVIRPCESRAVEAAEGDSDGLWVECELASRPIFSVTQGQSGVTLATTKWLGGSELDHQTWDSRGPDSAEFERPDRAETTVVPQTAWRAQLSVLIG